MSLKACRGFSLLTMIAVTAMLTTGGVAAGEDFRPQLTAFELASDQVHPGETLVGSYEFVNVGTAPASGEYAMFVHVRPAAPGDPDGKPAVGQDLSPATPTFAWLPNTVVRQKAQTLKIPADFPPGRYRLLIGVFDPQTGHRYKLTNDDLATTATRYRLADIEVVSKKRPLAGKPLASRWRDTAGLPDAEEAFVRQRPVDPPIELDNGKLRVRLSAARPVVLGYELPCGKKLGGDQSGYPVRVRLGRGDGGKTQMLFLSDRACFSLRRQGDEARYAVQVRQQDAVAASFDVVYRLEGNVLQVGVEKVREEAGFRLLDVLLPQLISAAGPTGQLVVPTQAGRLVRLDRSAPGRHVIKMDWNETDLCGVLVGEGVAAAIRTRDWDNELEARVSGGKTLSGGFAARLALRADADAKAAPIQLAVSPSVQIALLEKPGSEVTWVDAAKWLRQDVKGTPNPLYRDTVIYKIGCDTPGAKDYTTFDEALGIIRKMHQVAPWLKQVVYLVGWQYHGHDTGYPATDQINARLGGIEALRRVAAEAAKCNAVLSYHDNFDDAYRDSPRWDERLIARDPHGELQKGGIWAGGQSYILACKKYAAAAGLERVRRTVGQMPVRESYHLDVLSAVPIRRDYHRSAPESTRDSLEGKYAIIREFNRLGIDVTSEGFTAPFVGKIGHSWHFWRRDDRVFAGEEPIPFVAMIYHGGPTTYGHSASSPNLVQECLLDGAACAAGGGKKTKLTELAERLYLVVTPWTYLRERRMQDYQRQGSLCRVIYGPDTFVEIDRSNGGYRVVVDGATIVENGLTVAPKGDLVAVYAQTARQAKIRLPAAFQGRELRATNTCTGEEQPLRAETPSPAVTLNLPAGEPLLVRAK
jgi:hypothetical protein